MKNIARHSKSITIVGDPDQSIYGFRNANVANFKTMKEDFEGTEIVTLEENYRSTDCILDSGFHVIEQDDERIEKGLYTNNGKGTPISILNCESEIPESLTVAEEILRMVHFSKGLIQYKDIAILVRVHYLTQNMETALRASDIPYQIIGGVRFFERMEIKDLIAYVHFIYNANDTLSFERIINTPRRGVGEVILGKICTLSRVRDKTVLDVLTDLCSEQQTKKRKTSGGFPLWDFALPPRVKGNLKKFITLCTDAKAMMDNKESVRRILDYIIKFSGYQAYLKQDYKDHEVRWDNVGELMTIAGRYDKKAPAGEDQEGGEEGSQIYGDLASQAADDGSKPLIGDIDAFVANTTLDPDANDDRITERRNCVQLMTIHAAKGLEWPCVFILACEQGIIPHLRAENTNEEA
ncbi:DNA helicase [Absidia repens]|uniref:DNA 3'-5' helicase n=1 Tax=Absidia repens TaxID=90262 RepID=A0A1X2I2Q8_9FUNG|nr:DNA helicase [Absidia repens]